ncbi:MAG: hypothetical protein JNL71_10255 [Rhodospirillales bacterium]|nr:hypothetical protein [Rhodospirillales bacterium]
MRLGTLRKALCAVLLLAAGCATAVPGPAGVPRMGVRSFLDVRHMCALGVSPPIALDGAAGPGRYRVRMTNTSVLYAPPSDYEVAVDGAEIPEGALEGYRGICPGETQLFSIRIEVAALDAQGRTTAYGTTNVNAYSTTRTLRLPPDQRPRMPARQSP